MCPPRLLELLHQGGLVERVDNNAAGTSAWRPTAAGLAAIWVGHALVRPTRAAASRPGITAIAEKSLWELTVELAQQGWNFAVVPDRQRRRLAPYTRGANKEWYCSKAGPSSRNYLACLLSAGAGTLPAPSVPHFCTDKFYAELLAGRAPPLEHGRRKRS